MSAVFPRPPAPLPPPAPTPEDLEIEATRKRAHRAALNARGRAATIL